ncbi:hypothetical protein AB0K16_44625 [Nonomuraea jabiensis]|uniref:hypothetical protein n=1 Tax=Nonomuraea jabiensis TaxID=882448 RepID=UPI003429E9C9
MSFRVLGCTFSVGRAGSGMDGLNQRALTLVKVSSAHGSRAALSATVQKPGRRHIGRPANIGHELMLCP